MTESLGFPVEAVTIMTVVLSLSIWADLRVTSCAKAMTFKRALAGFIFWVALAVAFYFYIGWRFGDEYASLFMAGYALEKSLSIDNMMVFVAIFGSFGIKDKLLQHRILYFGIIGAIVFRGIFIGVGTTLFGLSVWVEIVFALIVLWSAWAILKGSESEEIEDYSHHWSVRLFKSFVPVVPRLYGKLFFISNKALQFQTQDVSLTKKAAWYATPAFLCLVCIEISDIVFSFDSVPAIIAVTRDPFLVYAASLFAILGLRTLYFMLSVAAQYLCHLEKAVAFVLIFIGFKLFIPALEKMTGSSLIHVSHQVSMWVVISLLALGVVASFVWPDKSTAEMKEIT